jgi:hypothetical protein
MSSVPPQQSVLLMTASFYHSSETFRENQLWMLCYYCDVVYYIHYVCIFSIFTILTGHYNDLQMSGMPCFLTVLVMGCSIEFMYFLQRIDYACWLVIARGKEQYLLLLCGES